MEEEEEAHTVADEATETTTDKVEAEDTITLTRAALLGEDYETILATACSTTVRSR